MSLAACCDQAGRQDVIFLPRTESHVAGRVLGLASVLLGVSAYQWQWPGLDVIGWVALVGSLLGMLLHWRWKKSDTGWRVDFGQRLIEPVGLRGQTETVSGMGWFIQVAPGERRTGISIDLRHEDRGRVVRLLDVPARGKADLKLVDQLAERLGQRLGIPRRGPRL